MKEFSKVSALAMGIVLCGVGMSSDASAANYYMTPEQDAKIQREGMEFNRRYDIEHGYYIPGVGPVENARRPVQVAPIRKHSHQIYQQNPQVRRPVGQQQMVQNRQSLAPAVRRPPSASQVRNQRNVNWQNQNGQAQNANMQRQELARRQLARQQALARRQARQQAIAQQRAQQVQQQRAQQQRVQQQRPMTQQDVTSAVMQRNVSPQRNIVQQRSNGNRRMAVGQQRQLVRPQMIQNNSVNWKTTETDLRMQEAALEYNRKFDMRYAR